MSMRKFGIPFVLLAIALVTSLIFVTASSSKMPDEIFSARQLKHWAYQKFERPPVPTVKNSSWVQNPIDAFILARMEAKNLEPSPRADKLTLIRRAYFDLTGLPPTPQEVDTFVADESPDAFAKVIDKLLASPHYGERWARHWLDLARYADSEGFKSDQTRPNVWRYRDYVIKSLNEDKPYNRFVREQIAGDELFPNDMDALVGTAFNRHYPDEHNARNLMQRRQEILHDITNTVGSVFLGLTMSCAQCHNHKFDPILQADYYRLQAFFANSSAKDDIVLASQEEIERHRSQLEEWESKTSHIRKEMAAVEAPQRKKILDDLIEKYPAEIRDAISLAPEKRTPFQWLMYYKAKPYLDPKSYIYQAPTETVVGKLGDEEKEHWGQLKSQLDSFANLHPGELPIGVGIVDVSDESPKTHILSGGAYDAPKEEVQPGFLSIFDPGPAKIEPLPGMESTGRRTALAEWLLDPDHPLTTRVMVNRLWYHHLGRGIVDTPSNFGVSGGVPSHPDLLNWLAKEFVSEGWSIKKIHRLIMTSNTYQQASLHREDAAKVDQDNKLIWHVPRQRLQGEIIRDAALAISGLLNPKMGGPSVFPALPPGMVFRGGWNMSEDSAEKNRRSIYVFIRRNSRYPMFETFDMPDTHESCARRDITTSPLQALTLLNSEIAMEWAQGFAGRILFSAGLDRDAQIEAAYRLAFSRKPTDEEQMAAGQFFNRHGSIVTERAANGEMLALPIMRPYNVDPVEAATLVDFCHMILNSNEFVYLN